MRRFIITLIMVITTGLAIGGAVTAAAGGGSAVTRARLERALPAEFANLYAAQADLLGHPGVTPDSLQAKAMCDKGGAVERDLGPGSNWICLIGWNDPDNPMPPEGYGKFELDVHTNGCYTAVGPSKLVGYATITDTSGHTVPNPVYEFDGCFDLQGTDAATGTYFPSLLTVTTTALRPDSQRRVGLQVTCGTGENGCHGKVTVTAGSVDLGSIRIDTDEEQTATLTVPKPVPSGEPEVTFAFQLDEDVEPTKPNTLEMPR